VLIAVNIFFIINLRVQYVNTRLISEDTRRTASEILYKSKIVIDADTIPDVKPNLVIYENSCGEDYHERVVTKITGTENFTRHMINNGTKCILGDSGDEFEFSDQNRFEVTYKKNTGSASAPDADYISAFNSSGTAVPNDTSSDMALKYAIRRFLFPGGDTSYDIVCRTVRYDTANGWYVVTAEETVDGYPLASQSGIVFVIKDGEVIYMSGEVMVLGFENDYSTELYDQVNILFTEKAYITSLRESESLKDIAASPDMTPAGRSPGEEPASASNDLYPSDTADISGTYDTPDTAESDANEYVIEDMSLVYCVSWNSDRTSFYMIPGWKIVYSDGTYRVRNALNGNIYTV